MKLKKAIIQQLKEAKQALSVEELYQRLGFQHSNEFKDLVKTIAIMEQEASIEMTRKGKLRLPQAEVVLEGTFRANERGFGFVTIDEEEPDIFIPKGKTLFALNGDKVKVELLKTPNPWEDKAAEGQVIEIVEHAVSELVGTVVLKKGDWGQSQALFEAQDKRLKDQVILISDQGLSAEEGSICLADIIRYPSAEQAMQVVIKEVIGHKDDPGIDILSIVLAHGIDPEFQEATLAEAKQVPAALDLSHLDATRRDLRDQCIITIDGDETKDFDDAVHVHKNEAGHYILGVHIADVAHYVHEGSALDKEAAERGTSVYLADRVIPMLPRRLSNGICSLNPQVPRYTLSCEMEIDTSGKVLRYQIYKSIIQTAERMTYRHVNAILAGDEALCARYQSLVPMLHDMADLHHILEKMREKRGAISFEDTEAKIKVDENGKAIGIELRQRGVAERLIESFMLVANETVAYHFQTHQWPFLYRVHEQPDEQKLQRFFEFLTNFGLQIEGTKKILSSKALQKLLNEVKNTPEEAVINMMMLRSMQQAKYDVQPLGHYGLAAKDYTHFTSPIRRYPDLIVHRLIHYFVIDQKRETEHWEEVLPEIASHSSTMERVAVDTEREVDAMKKAEYMMQFIGQEFTAVISSVVKFGLFVELDNTVEGLVHMSTMNDYYEFFENQMVLIGKRSRRTYRLGQQVKVRLTKADPQTREIDFILVEDHVEEKPTKNKRSEKRQQRSTKESHYKKEKTSKHKKGKKKGSKKKTFYESVPRKHKKKGRRK